MEELNKPKYGPVITEPTELEIQKTVEDLRLKRNIELSRIDAIRYAKLTQELEWWLKIEKQLDDNGNITEATAKEIQDFVGKHHGRDISQEKAALEAERSLLIGLPLEKERLAAELRAIIAQYKQD